MLAFPVSGSMHIDRAQVQHAAPKSGTEPTPPSSLSISCPSKRRCKILARRPDRSHATTVHRSVARHGTDRSPSRKKQPPITALMEELVEEILLRVPPDEPAHLIRAGLVCKDWCRIISDGGFRRRYRRFHPTPPLLGYINDEYSTGLEFVPTTTFSPPPLPATKSSFKAIDCRHGRLLMMIDTRGDPPGFIVWDLITGNGPRLTINIPAYHPHLDLCNFTGAVLCARHGCDHLDCHDGPFLVAFVGTYAEEEDVDDGDDTCTFSASVYSSETGAWSAQTSADYDLGLGFGACSLLIGDALYVTLLSRVNVLKYDLGPLGDGCGTMLRRSGRHISISSQFSYMQPDIIRFAEGTNTILFRLNNYIDLGVYTLDLKSGQVRRVGETRGYDILPCMSFYTPDLAKGKLSPR